MRSERERLGLTINAIVGHTGVSKGTQIKYEAGTTSPSATYLATLDAMGADAFFIVTGRRSMAEAGLSADQGALLDSFNRADPDAKKAALMVLDALARLEPAGAPAKPASDMSDAELWRAVARSLPTTPGIDPEGHMSVVDFLRVVDQGFEYAKSSRASLAKNSAAS